ncbi:YiiD C-terminal domain-containing protein [Neptuniibacter sp. 2_MG-2023]|uniref:YiiD C-terminal domain-containing protein n=1 Tax=Neptuniibacter sp. 2_MG-2023 TaxID=3062671 RepID=UPI0026E2071B|nr:YiiD C-terminal domain-containing protein [Neptuniibacter sp. 2_MG-2023]MDO6513021.1 YiiD C-terminal domain-containing protein [Neptuniibacter sp. 2_MG-2023]
MTDYNQIAEEFLVKLKGQIPLINHLGLFPLKWDGTRLEMKASLAPNVNDKGTGFGGSLATVATLCGWSIVTLYLKSQGRNDDVVIRDSHIEYFLPITTDFTASTSLPDEGAVSLFYQKMLEKGRARMDLIIDIKQDDKIAMRLTGSYIALEKRR